MKFSIKNFKLGNVFRNVSSKVKTGNVNKLVDGIKKVNKSFDQASRSLNASKEYNFNGIETIPYSDTKDSNSGSSSVNATGPTTAVIAVYNECINLIKSNKSFDINNVNDNSSRKCTFLCEQNAPGLKKKLKKYINDNYGKTWHASILNDNVIKALVNLNKNMINSNNTIRELNGRAASVPSSKLSEEDEKKSEENSFAGMQTPLEAYKNMLEKQRKESPPSPPVRTKKKSDETLQHHAEVDARHTSVKSDFNSHTDAAAQSPIGKEMAKVSHSNEEPVKAPQHHAEVGAKNKTNDQSDGIKKGDLNSQTEKKVGGQEEQIDRNTDPFDYALNSLNSGAPVNSAAIESKKDTEEIYNNVIQTIDEVTGESESSSNTSGTEKVPALSGNGGVHAASVGKKVVTPSYATKQTTDHTTAAPTGKKGTAPKQNVHVGAIGGAVNDKSLAKSFNEKNIKNTNNAGARALPNRGAATLPQHIRQQRSISSQNSARSATLNHVPTTSSEKEKTLLQNFGKATIIINNIKNIKEKSKDLETIYNLVRKDITPYAADESMAALYNDIAEAVSYYMEYAKLDDSALFNNYKKLGMVIDKFKNNWNDIPENAQGLVGGLIELREKMTPPPVPARQSVSQPPAPPLPARRQSNHVSVSDGSIQTGTRARMPLPTQGRVLPPNPSPSSMGEATRQTSSGQVTPPVDVSSVSAPQTSSTPAAPQTSSVPPAPPLPKREVEKQAESSADAPAPQAFSTSATSSAPPAPPAPSAPAAPAAQMSSTPGSTSTIANELQKVMLRKTPPKDNSVGANTDTAVTDMTTLLRNALKGRHVAMQDSEEPETDSDEWTD